MTSFFINGGIIAFAYLLGSVATAVVIARLSGLPDPRLHGSGNPGATNVLRLGGKQAAALTLLGDMAKGLIPVLTARALGVDNLIVAAAGCAALIGHIYPVFFRFRGGKGVATALGVLFGLSVWLGIVALTTWVVTAALSKISSLAALVAAATAPIVAFSLPLPTSWATATLVLAILVIARHTRNIQRLLAGTEPKIGQ